MGDSKEIKNKIAELIKLTLKLLAVTKDGKIRGHEKLYLSQELPIL